MTENHTKLLDLIESKYAEALDAIHDGYIESFRAVVKQSLDDMTKKMVDELHKKHFDLEAPEEIKELRKSYPWFSHNE